MFMFFSCVKNRAGVPFCFKDYSKDIKVDLYISMQYFTGVFIMLCFTTTKKVRGLLKDRLFKRRNGKVEPQTSVTRDRRTGNSDVITVPTGSSNFNMTNVSREKGREKSS